MNYILTIKTLIEAIKAVEELMPESAGKEKFSAAIELVEAVVGSVQGSLPALQRIATLIVTAFRATGAFTKKTA